MSRIAQALGTVIPVGTASDLARGYNEAQEPVIAKATQAALQIIVDAPATYERSAVVKTLRGTGGLRKHELAGCLMGEKAITNNQLNDLVDALFDAINEAGLANSTDEQHWDQHKDDDENIAQRPEWVHSAKRNKAGIQKLAETFKETCGKLEIAKTAPPAQKPDELLAPAEVKALVESKIRGVLEVTEGAFRAALHKRGTREAEKLQLKLNVPPSGDFNSYGQPGTIHLRTDHSNRTYGHTTAHNLALIKLVEKKKSPDGVNYIYRIGNIHLHRDTYEKVQGERHQQEVWIETVPVVKAIVRPDQSVTLDFGWLSRQLTSNSFNTSTIKPNVFEPSHELDFLLKKEARVERAQARIDQAAEAQTQQFAK